ncbi:MAG: alpha-mannosidase, partial [Anaerolineaceae bacterium]|nr:alpha-mannosidase [Anaerolineaceae bacterium]
ELAGQESDGTNTLCNTASAHVPIKILNRRNESILSLSAEPLISMAVMSGMKADNALLDRAWKLLIQNHPHDSICSCGVDPVNREVIGRFEKSIQLGNYLTGQAGEYLADTIQAPGLNTAEAAFAVFNPSGWERSQVVTLMLGAGREYGTRDAYPKVVEKDLAACYLCDSTGKTIPAQIEDTGAGFGYELPDDTFRKPYFERKLRVSFKTDAIPAYGYEVYYLKRGNEHPLKTGMRKTGNNMENCFLSVSIQKNGTFDITDKTSGKIYKDLGRYEDTGDAGDEYVFRETTGRPVMTGGSDASITCTEDSEIRTVFRIDLQILLPVSADRALTDARNAMIHRLNRNNIARSSETIAYPISTYLTLEKDSPVLKIRTELNNTVKDHRLRMLFPTDLVSDWHLADSVFDVVKRNDVPGPNWTNPSRCQRMQYFAAVEDEHGGLAVINRGMYEYEILPERKQIAVTILRSVGEMGDWGVFPTPDAQCLEPVITELAVFPYVGSSFIYSGCREAVHFQTDMPVFQIHSAGGTLPERGCFMKCRGKGLVFSALKPSEDEKALILRVFNITDENSELCINLSDDCVCYESSIVEEKGEHIRNDKAENIRIPVGKKEIKSIRIESGRYE